MRALNIRPGVRAVSDRLFRLVEPYPGLYFPLYSFYNLPLFGLAKGYVGKTIRRDTELVIEGFPGQGIPLRCMPSPWLKAGRSRSLIAFTPHHRSSGPPTWGFRAAC